MTYTTNPGEALRAVINTHVQTYDKYEANRYAEPLVPDTFLPTSDGIVSQDAGKKPKVVFSRASSSETEPDAADDQFAVLREAQIRWTVAALLNIPPRKPRAGFRKISENPFKYIERLRLYGKGGHEILRKYTLLYVSWWDAAYYSTGEDIYDDLLVDMSVHLSAAAKEIKRSQLERLRGASRLVRHHITRPVRSRWYYKFAKEGKKLVARTLSRDDSDKRSGYEEPSVTQEVKNEDDGVEGRASCPLLDGGADEGKEGGEGGGSSGDDYQEWPESVQTWAGRVSVGNPGKRKAVRSNSLCDD